MSDGFNLRLRRPRPSVVACSPTLGALGAVNLMPACFAKEDALEAHIARSSRRRRAVSVLLRWLTYAAATVTAAVLLFVVGYILVRGVPALTPDLFQWEYTSENVSLLPALASTVIMALLALALAVPAGVGASIYLVEYARRGSRFVRLVRVTAETLQGIPSIIYGLFGMLFFVTACGWGLSLLSGACTLAIMVLPVIMRTTEEAIRAVPRYIRWGAYGLGATKWQVVSKIVLPSAFGRIATGIVLAIGRAIGETAVVLYTMGQAINLPISPLDSGRPMTVHLYLLANDGINMNAAYGTALLLMVIILAFNLFARYLSRKRR